MFDSPSTATTITDVLVWLRELSVIGVIAGVAWKTRGFWDDALKFIERIETHMTTMERFVQTITENHLKHIEKALNTMANIEPDKESNDQN